MLRLVEAQNRIQWETFTVQDEFSTQFMVNVGIAIVSEPMTDFMLSKLDWHGVSYLDIESGEYKIGYGQTDPDLEQGATEVQAYADWIGYVRNRQKTLRAQLPVIGIPQATYDALVSLFVNTGKWRTVDAEEGTYDLANAVSNSNWLLVSDIISRGNTNPSMRQAEAAVSRLGAYQTGKDRNQQIVQGLQSIRKQYIRGYATDFETKQAEFVYYRQLGSFLPGMSQLRQRRVVAQATNFAI